MVLTIVNSRLGCDACGYLQGRTLNCPTLNLEVCHPRCVCENWKRYVVKHKYVN